MGLFVADEKTAGRSMREKTGGPNTLTHRKVKKKFHWPGTPPPPGDFGGLCIFVR